MNAIWWWTLEGAIEDARRKCLKNQVDYWVAQHETRSGPTWGALTIANYQEFMVLPARCRVYYHRGETCVVWMNPRHPKE